MVPLNGKCLCQKVKLICAGLFIVTPVLYASPAALISIHAFDIYPTEYLELFDILKSRELSKQFVQLYRRFSAVPDRFYAEARFEFPELEKHIRGSFVHVQQKAKHMNLAARDFLEFISQHVEIVLIGSQSKIKKHVTSIISQWSELSTADKDSYREQFPDSALILDSDRYQQLIKNNTKQ